METTGTVVAVCRSAEPGLPKPVVEQIELIENFGVENDYHAGKFVRHRYLAKKDPTQPNLRQVLLADAQTFTELSQEGIEVGPGVMGENITTTGLTLMTLPVGTQLKIGTALLEVTELRIPCKQLNGAKPNLLKAVTTKESGKKSYKAGILTRVLKGGPIRAGDVISVVIGQPYTAG